jgi:Gram-negative bacterial TonB protein C-terminal
MWRAMAAVGFVLFVVMSGSALPYTSDDEASKPEAKIAKLSEPIYPPLARAAHVDGDVSLKVRLRADGTVESVDDIAGHPMLKKAAIESAERSQFDCSRCTEPIALYLTYTFRFTSNGCCSLEPALNESRVEEQVGVTLSENHITLTTNPFCTCDSAATVTYAKVRSIECLYLWKCRGRSH